MVNTVQHVEYRYASTYRIRQYSTISSDVVRMSESLLVDSPLFGIVWTLAHGADHR